MGYSFHGHHVGRPIYTLLFVVYRADGSACTQAPRAVPHYNFLRKPASDSGWDWGPAFAAAGLGSVYIEACMDAHISKCASLFGTGLSLTHNAKGPYFMVSMHR